MKSISIEKTKSFPVVIDPKKVRKNIRTLINHLTGYKSYELNILLVNDPEMKEINKERRGKDKTTDVLSFPLLDLDIPTPHKTLGEIVISGDTLLKQAEEIGHSNLDEFYRLLVHGLLHLLGYDHEVSTKEEERMKQKEDECLEIIFREKL